MLHFALGFLGFSIAMTLLTIGLHRKNDATHDHSCRRPTNKQKETPGRS